MKKIIIVIILILFIIFFSRFFLVSRNNKYMLNIEKEIRDNYQLNDKINYLNKYNLYYIIMTDENLIVLNNDYQEVFKEKVNKIKKINKEHIVVYRLNSVMYEVKKIGKSKIIYEYYDIYTNELIDIVEVGG